MRYQCTVPTPQHKFSSSFLSSDSVRSTPYGPSVDIRILCHWQSVNLVSQILPVMHPTYTTTRILNEFSVTRQRPITSHHPLWAICWHWYFVTLVICEFSITYPARNAPYPHHNTSSPRVFCHQTASDHLPPLPMGHLLTLVFCDIGNLWI